MGGRTYFGTAYILMYVHMYVEPVPLPYELQKNVSDAIWATHYDVNDSTTQIRVRSFGDANGPIV